MDVRIGFSARSLACLLACLVFATVCALPRAVVAQELPASDTSQAAIAGERPSEAASGQTERPEPALREQTSETAEPAEPADGSQRTGEAAANPADKQARTITASVRLDGPDGTLAAVEGMALQDGASAWDATKLVLAQSGLDYRLGADSAQDVIASVTDSSGDTVLKLDAKTGGGWHLYLNAERYQGFASTAKLRDGDEVVWRYEVPSFEVSVAVVGPGGTGTEYWIAPTSVAVNAGQNAWDATYAVLAQNGLAVGRLLSYSVGEDGSVLLESLSGLGESGITGESWQVFVNGAPAESDAAHVALHAGDSVCWYYVGNGVSELPTFVEETGAASPNPAAGIRVDGKVTQAWSAPMAKRGSLSDAPRLESGLVVLGGGLPAVVACDVPGTSCAIQTNTGVAWRQSMANTLEKRLYTGQGGKATLARDGSLYYVDDLGSLVKLEVRPEE